MSCFVRVMIFCFVSGVVSTQCMDTEAEQEQEYEELRQLIIENEKDNNYLNAWRDHTLLRDTVQIKTEQDGIEKK
jgi:hypothetical protein